jgi:PAS domain S-box-containing protein
MVKHAPHDPTRPAAEPGPAADAAEAEPAAGGGPPQPPKAEVYRHFFENANIGLALTSPDKGFLAVNPKLCDLLGYPEAELKATTWAALTHPDDLAADVREFARLQAGASDRYALNKRFLRKDGSTLAAHLTVHGERAADGNLALVYASIEDRSEEQAAFEALAVSERRFRLLADSTLDGLWDWDIDANTLWLSPSWKAQLGYLDHELANAFATWDRLLHPDDHERVMAHLGDFLADPAAVWQDVFRLQHRDGTWRRIMARGMAVHAADGHVARIFGVHIDITAEREAAAELKALSADLERILKERTRELAASEARYRNIADYTIDWETWLDAEGRLRYCSPACERMTGHPPRAFLADAGLLGRIIHPEDRTAWHRHTEALLHDRLEARLEYRICWSDGQVRWLERFDHPMHDDDGNYLGMRGSTRDITEVRAARLALEREKTFIEAVLNAARALILVLSPEGTVVRVNPYSEQLTGWHPDDLIGRNWIETCLPEPDRAETRRMFRQALTATRTQGHINPILARNGRQRFISWYDELLRTRDGEPEFLVAVGIDVTERLRIEQALKEANERLEEKVRARTKELTAAHAAMVQSEKLSSLGTLVAGLSHEINNPLMGIINYVAFARDESSGQTAAMLAKADRELHRIADMLNNLLRFSRPRDGVRVRVELAEVADAAAALLRADLRGRQIELALELPADLPAARGEPGGLQQVILNLLINARDALAEAPVRRIRIVGGSDSGQVWLDVADTGPGVPAAARGHIFEAFYSTKPAGVGTGLGLAVSCGIVEGLGGSLELLEDAPGRGAVFRLRLPAASGV